MPTAAAPPLPLPIEQQGVALLEVPSSWRAVDIISDLHLIESEPFNFIGWRRYMESTEADAVILLGDWFDVWVGDDAANTAGALPTRHEGLSFLERCARVMRYASEKRQLYVMHGNRDFLLGADFLAACNATLLHDPCVLQWGETRYALSHGDTLCTEDHAYLKFRAQVRTAAWQREFLSQDVASRICAAQHMRQQSMAAQRDRAAFVDVTEAACTQLLQDCQAAHLIHGHTHTGTDHALAQPPGARRHVTSDWQLHHTPAKADALRITADGVKRIDLSAFLAS
jgi:UDP-2,3-diacylglucosamine hydrolase